MASIELSENHRRSISITLQLLDKALCEWSDWSAGKTKSGVMYREQDTLSSSQKSDLRSKIDEIRKLIVLLRDEFDLQLKNVATAHAIATHSSLLWEMLAELNIRTLQAYGTVPEGLGAHLDPIGEQLAEHMSAITRLLAQTATE